MTSPLEVAKDLFCGCVSGWGQVTSMLPFENIKIKMISKPEEYNQGYIHAVTKTLKQQGFFSLYKGMLFPLIGVGAQVSVQFGVVQSLKKIMKQRYADASGKLHPIYSFYSGLISGIPSAILVTPQDHARFKVTLVKEKGMGSVAMATSIYKQHGLMKLYRGFWPTLIRESIGLGCWFGVYDLLIRHFTHDGKVNLLGSVISGSAAGIGFWIFIYPVDYVKTVIQGDSLVKPKYNGMFDCFRKEAPKGLPVFYTGFVIMMSRAIVASSASFVCFQLAKKMVY